MAHEEAVKALLQALDDRTVSCATSELTIAEVLVKPFAHPDLRYRKEYEELLSENPGLSVVQISRQVLERSAKLRAAIGGKLADAIHVATADLSGCTHFLSEDSRIKLPDNLTLVTLAMLSPFLQPAQERP